MELLPSSHLHLLMPEKDNAVDLLRRRTRSVRYHSVPQDRPLSP